MKSVLGTASSANIFLDPFPHMVVENAIDDKIVDQLIDEIPTPEILANGQDLGSNNHFVWDYVVSHKSDKISNLWKEFLGIHVDRSFYEEVIGFMGEHMNTLNPIIEEKSGHLEDLTTGIRKVDTREDFDLMLDAQVFVQTPVVGKPNSYRIGHLDGPNKLFNGLFYLRLPGDDSVGANLEMCKLTGDSFKMHNKNRKLIEDKYLETAKVIPYKANTFVLIPNSIQSIHRVQVRQKTKWPRYYMNVLADFNYHLFDTTPYWEGPLDTIRRKLKV